MSRLRLLLFWLLVLAVPLQGFAATSKLLCGSAGALQAGAGHVQAQGEDGHHVHADVQTPAQFAVAADAASALPDSTAHQCGLCAACCHAVASGYEYQLVFAAPAPQADLPEPGARITTRGLRLPEKPPRG
jgi:hypothetical protein